MKINNFAAYKQKLADKLSKLCLYQTLLIALCILVLFLLVCENFIKSGYGILNPATCGIPHALLLLKTKGNLTPRKQDAPFWYKLCDNGITRQNGTLETCGTKTDKNTKWNKDSHSNGGLKQMLSAVNQTHLVLQNWSSMKNVSGLLYNRVPKCGSTTTQVLIKSARKLNHFNYDWSRIYDERRISLVDQEKWATHVASLPQPFLYDRHVHFVNFTQFKLKMPIYINLLRDPVDRFVSAYYYKREKRRKFYTKEAYYRTVNECIEEEYDECLEKKSFVTVPFFCGQEGMCQYPTPEALNRAKRNIVKYFAIVGLTEEYSSYLKVLECVFPQYFQGIVNIYGNSSKAYKVTTHKDKILPHNRQKMARTLQLEYELYNFVKTRFEDLYNKLKHYCPL